MNKKIIQKKTTKKTSQKIVKVFSIIGIVFSSFGVVARLVIVILGLFSIKLTSNLIGGTHYLTKSPNVMDLREVNVL